ncbi:MAG: hypothetical protein EBT13_00855 [Rhodobacteraceae bacterium]|nr:hypothetical protein [Paracoccaceae bacterium]
MPIVKRSGRDSRKDDAMSNVTTLARDWLEAKRAEQEAAERRINIEAQLAAALDVKDEGAITHKIDGYKVTLTQPVYRSVDAELWEKIKDRVPVAMRPVKVKLEADATGIKYLANNEPEIWNKIAEAFTTKPGKIGIKIQEDK